MGKIDDGGGEDRPRGALQAGVPNPDRFAEFAAIGHALLDEVLPLAQPVRLVGLTLSALDDESEPAPPLLGVTQGTLPF